MSATTKRFQMMEMLICSEKETGKRKSHCSTTFYGRTLSDASMLYFADVLYFFFMAALVGQTAERIFTKLSHVVDIRCYLRTY